MSLRIFERAMPAAILATLLLSLPAAAAAQTAEATAQARAAVQEGARLFEKKEYEAALAQFQAAFAAVPSPKLHYNFGLTYLALGRKPDAVEAFESFLRDTEAPPPVQKLKATQQIEALRKDIMSLALTCNVDGAKVVIDGRLRGFTPVTRRIPLEPGPHELLMEKEGTHDPIRQMVVGTAGETVALTVTMEEQAARQREALAATPAELPSQPPLMPAIPAQSAPEEKPFYTRGWFWGAVGVVVVAAAVGAYFALSSQDSSSCPPNIEDCKSVP